jgi:molybdenum cofactor synthesis domain-containing protein
MGYQAAVITVSDKGYKGEREDKSGPAVAEMLTEAGFEVVYTGMVPDEKAMIEAELILCADEKHIPLVLTTGGTGFSQRDITPEATLAVIEREARGIPETMLYESLKITPRACLSRAVAGLRGKTLIINLPGSVKAAKENLAAVLPALEHGLQMLMADGSTEH